MGERKPWNISGFGGSGLCPAKDWLFQLHIFPPIQIIKIWWFPKIGVPLLIIHFSRMFHEINHPFWDTHLWKSPNDTVVQIQSLIFALAYQSLQVINHGIPRKKTRVRPFSAPTTYLGTALRIRLSFSWLSSSPIWWARIFLPDPTGPKIIRVNTQAGFLGSNGTYFEVGLTEHRISQNMTAKLPSGNQTWQSGNSLN